MKLTDSPAWLSMREQTRKSSRDVLTRERVAVRSQLPEAKPEAAAVAVIRATVHSFVPVATRTRNPRPLVPPITPAARLENSTAQLRPLLLACYFSPPLIMPPHFCDNETHGRPIMTVYLDTRPDFCSDRFQPTRSLPGNEASNAPIRVIISFSSAA